MMKDLTREHPDKILWRFLLPMLVSVMFQQIYNIADSCIAGRFAGEDALAAVGASYPITVIFMAFAVGTNLGASVVVSRLFGAKDMARMKSAVSTAFVACAFMSFFLTLIGYFFCGSMMRAVHTPENIFADGQLYLKIYVYGITFLLLYNVCTGIFTALGDSKTPLYFLIGSSVGNIILDYYFVACVGLGVAGVAWATFIAQGISAILALTFLAMRLKKINCEGTFQWLDLVLLAQIAAIAIPSHYAARRFIHWKYVCPGDRKPLWFRGDRRLFRCYQVKYFCYQFIYGSWKLSFQLYGPEPGSRKERTAAFGISYRYPFISNCFPSFYSPLFLCQQTDDGAVFK